MGTRITLYHSWFPSPEINQITSPFALFTSHWPRRSDSGWYSRKSRENVRYLEPNDGRDATVDLSSDGRTEDGSQGNGDGESTSKLDPQEKDGDGGDLPPREDGHGYGYGYGYGNDDVAIAMMMWRCDDDVAMAMMMWR